MPRAPTPPGIRAAREQEQFARDQERLAEAQVGAWLPGTMVEGRGLRRSILGA